MEDTYHKVLDDRIDKISKNYLAPTYEGYVKGNAKLIQNNTLKI